MQVSHRQFRPLTTVDGVYSCCGAELDGNSCSALLFFGQGVKPHGFGLRILRWGSDSISDPGPTEH